MKRLWMTGFLFVLAGFLGGGWGCERAVEEAEVAGGGGKTIVIEGFAFDPLNLEAEAGETIQVINSDAVTHTVTSESAPNAFDDNGDFDSGAVGGGEEGSITLPADAGPGDIFHFYCAPHKGTMATPNGTITIVAP